MGAPHVHTGPYDTHAAQVVQSREQALARVPTVRRPLCEHACVPSVRPLGRCAAHAKTAAPRWQDAHLAVNGLAPSRRRRAQDDTTEDAAAPIRITAVFQLATSAALPPATAGFLQYALVPAALAEIARYVAVRRPVRCAHTHTRTHAHTRTCCTTASACVRLSSAPLRATRA